MDNKKWYRRFGTVFWWTLTILPFVVALIYFIGYHLTFNSGISSAQELTDYHIAVEGGYLYNLDVVVQGGFNGMSLDFLNTMFTDLFDLLNVSWSDTWGFLLGYMVSIQFYHLFFDFVVWLPRFFHSIMEKGFDKL